MSHHTIRILAVALLMTAATTASAVSVTSTRTVNLLEDGNPVASPWFTLAMNGTTTLGTGSDINAAYPLQQNILLKGQNYPVAGGAVQAGTVSVLNTHGTYTLTGNSTLAGGWTDGNGIPAGVVVKFNTDVQFSVDAGSYLTLSGTNTANGLGITQTAPSGGVGTGGTIEPGETLHVSDVTVSNITFTGAPTESGYTFSGLNVGNFGPYVIRSGGSGTAGSAADGFYEAGETAGLFLASNPSTAAIGFGDGATGVGTVASHKIIENGFGLNTDTAGNTNLFTRQIGAWDFKMLGGTLATQAAALKGIGYEYLVTYDITPTPVFPPGDYNKNGVVDAADYVLWAKGDLAADSNGDTVVDQVDYDFWRGNFGNPNPPGAGSGGLAGSAVPEPASVVMLILGFLGSCIRRRGDRSQL
jgi:hypothetical protein